MNINQAMKEAGTHGEIKRKGWKQIINLNHKGELGAHASSVREGSYITPDDLNADDWEVV